MTSIYVTPRPGGRVRMPDRGFRPMPVYGAWVPRTDFYERLLLSGDIVIATPPAEPAAATAAAPAAAVAPAAAPVTPPAATPTPPPAATPK